MINNLSSLTDDSCQTNDLIVEEEENDEYYLNQLQRFSLWIQDQGENVISPDAKYARTRRLIARFLNTMAVHVTIIVLASLDAVILIAVQLLTIEALKTLVDTSSPKNLKTKLEDAQFGLECVSISIISLFMIEITVKFFVFGPKHFCAHWMDVLDGVVTLISLALDAFLIADHLLHITKGVEAFEAAAALIIVFRLWRIVRIVNGKSFE
ncbi:hypothetical protein P879_01794 [Paragonimus westermani]|uniref:Voltage-gated hydrogen channel 1 n=1 Tax=Paragonimus westermani TaxID=34504 RepID=A0A8T0DX72_9TREM|nr:hypothetical protein P879_01794 [Paragonimus westermani]